MKESSQVYLGTDMLTDCSTIANYLDNVAKVTWQIEDERNKLHCKSKCCFCLTVFTSISEDFILLEKQSMVFKPYSLPLVNRI